MTFILAIESSFETCSVALQIDNDVRQLFFREPRQAGRHLLPAVDELMADGQISFSQLDAIAFSCGPGSFTSLRLGIGVVQGLAWARNLGVVPVSSLQTTALSALEKVFGDGVASFRTGACVAVAMDARMDEVFFGKFSLDPQGLPVPADGAAGIESVGAPAQALERMSLDEDASGRQLLAAGNGFKRYTALANWTTKNSVTLRWDVWPEAGAVARLATEWLKNAEPRQASSAQPVYLRNKVADKPS